MPAVGGTDTKHREMGNCFPPAPPPHLTTKEKHVDVILSVQDQETRGENHGTAVNRQKTSGAFSTLDRAKRRTPCSIKTLPYGGKAGGSDLDPPLPSLPCPHPIPLDSQPIYSMHKLGHKTTNYNNNNTGITDLYV